MRTANPKPVDGDQWKEYGQKAISRIVGREETLVNYAQFNLEERAIVGALLIPEAKRYSAVTEIQYHFGCNEVSLLLWGLLAQNEHPMVSPYIKPEEFERARDENRFHKVRIKDLCFRRLLPPDEPFVISQQLLTIRRIAATEDRPDSVYAVFRVGDDAITGELHYMYLSF